MIRTLEIYLGKDLARATVLAALPLTLVLTVFTVLEPLRQQGLSSAQALKLFGYSMPLMFSLTLPIAALFAATIVYGRFGQDNELMACRASGICTLSLMKPAIYLGASVTVATLFLALYVAPKLWTVSERTIKHNLRQITYHRLKSRNCIHIPRSTYLFHVDRVDPETGWVEGPVLLDYADADNAWCLAAASAQLEFHQRGPKTLVVFHWTDPAAMRQRGGDEFGEDEQRIKVAELPGMPEGQPRLYDWRKLWDTWRRPEKNPVVRRELEQIKRELLIGMFYEDVVRVMAAEKKYDRLYEADPIGGRSRSKRLELAGGEASLYKAEEVHLDAAAPAPASNRASPRSVFVREFIGERLDREYLARSARVKGTWRSYQKAPSISVTLLDVDVRLPGLRGRALHRDSFTLGPYAAPAELLARVKDVSLSEMVEKPESFSSFPAMINRIHGLRKYTIRKLLAKVRAEIHLRLSYSVSCFLMVVLGAALGLLWRGGQMLAAFAIAAVPGAVVVAALFMGRELIRNPGVRAGGEYGMAVIWGGIALLTAAAAAIYAGPLRR